MSDGIDGPNPKLAPPIGVRYWVAAGMVAGMAFWFNNNYVLHHFLRGPYMNDTGAVAGMVYHPTLDLQWPIAAEQQVSFYPSHVAPLLYLLGLPSYLLPDILPVFYAKFIGLMYALLGLAGTLAAEPLTRKWGWRGPLAAGLAGLGLAFSGISLGAIQFPHYELYYAGLAVLFFALLMRGQSRWATVPFGLALLVREDAGLHLFGILALLFLGASATASLRSWRKLFGGYALAALSYAVVVIALQKTFFHGDDSLGRIYLGSPAFAHWSVALVTKRLGIYLSARKYVFAPWLLLLGLAAVRRSWLLAIGAVAVVPWIILNLLAKWDLAGEFSIYYPFPLLVTLIWPILIYPLEIQRGKPGALVIGSALVLFSSLLFFRCEHPSDFSHILHYGMTPVRYSAAEYESGQQELAALANWSPDIMYSTTVAALYPRDIPNKLIYGINTTRQAPKVWVGFSGEVQHPGPLLGEGSVWNCYVLPNPHLYILSQQLLPAVMQAVEPLRPKGMVKIPWTFASQHPGLYADFDAEGNIVDEAPHPDGLVVSGPNLSLVPGAYTVNFQWEAAAASPDDRLTFAVTCNSGQRVLVQTEINGDSLQRPNEEQTITLSFKAQASNDDYEFLVGKAGTFKIKIENITVGN